MSDPAVTTAWARAFMDELARVGLEHVCVAPGSRPTPLVMACAMDARFTTWVHLDERSAGFFALGIGKATRNPAAVITTSGTATANLFPAVIEASRSGVPLLVLTADRPLRLRGSDANQTIDQEGIYGSYPRESLDAGDPALENLRETRALACKAVARTLGPDPGPVHVNLPFDKPLEPVDMDPARVGSLREADPWGLDGRPDGAPMEALPSSGGDLRAGEVEGLVSFLRGGERGLIVAGPVADPDHVGPALIRLSATTGFPLLADPLSGARFGHDCGSPAIATSDLFLRDPAARGRLRPDLILRVGRPPTSAGVLTFLEECGSVPSIVIGAGHPQKDSLSTGSRYVQADVAALLAEVATGVSQTVAPAGWSGVWERLDRAAREAVQRVGGDFFEGDILSAVVETLPEGGTLFVSNSMPVRDLDAFGGAGPKRLRIFGNRGASGIDGIVSTVAGVAAATSSRAGDSSDRNEPPMVAVLGDLAFYHDMNGLFAVRENRLKVLFVVINNDGGGIFHMLPIREHEPEFTRYFATPHGLDFRHAADLYGIPYRRLDDPTRTSEALREALLEPGPRILEIRTDRDENQRRHQEVIGAVVEAVRREIEVA